MKRAIYPGTFDPVTFGHLDILARATELFDEVIVAVSKQSSKATLFTLDERLTLLATAVKDKRFKNKVQVKAFSGLVVRFAEQQKVKALVRGLRAISDFDYEFQMALMNRHQSPKIETVFLMPDEKYVYLSSSTVREVARLRGNLRALLPDHVINALHKKYGH